jgi:hypothetical protein
MANIKPSFITGANAKIKVGGKTFAYATDVSYGVSVDVVPVETMGRFEAVTNEPINYSVGGSLAIVRYTKLAASAASGGIPSTNGSGNGLGNVTLNGGDTTAADHMNPGNLLMSRTWDLEIFQKHQEVGAAATVDTTSSFTKIIDCRFTRKSAQITKRNILVEQYSFVGILAQDDSFEVAHSGDTDLES